MAVIHDFWGGANLPVCPAKMATAPEWQQHQATAAIFLLWAGLAVGFAVLTGLRFNSVSVFEQTVHAPVVSNARWMAYFAAVCTHGLLNGCRYLLTIAHASVPDTLLFLTANMADGLAASLLLLALNHQRVFRGHATGVSLQGAGGGAGRIAMLARVKRWKLLSFETLAGVLFVAFSALLLAQVCV
jgi:hypothetical protein